MSTGDLVAWIAGIGLRGPGLASWAEAIPVLRGERPYEPAPTVLVAPTALPATERRRVGKGVKIALDAGFAATENAGRDQSTLASVFTSSSGDGDNCDAICRELAGDRMISPTRFHNSVHNAPSGYWGIAAKAMPPSTSLCAYDDSFIAGLDEAMVQLANGVEAVLLVAYDAPYPEPLRTARPTPDCFGVGLVLTREAGPTALARVVLTSGSTAPASQLADAALEACRTAIPAARVLPLLAALARREAGDVAIARASGERLVLRVDGFASGTGGPQEIAPARGATACV
jgi:hypothetical protein